MNIMKTVLYLTLSMVISTFFSIQWIERREQIYSVDLGKIMSAQMLLAGRMASQGVDKDVWMTAIKDVTPKVKQVIHSIAGNHTVIVGPAIVQGANDITDAVLKKLGLPTNLPNLTVSRQDVIPSLIPKTDVKADTKIQIRHSQKDSWLLP